MKLVRRRLRYLIRSWSSDSETSVRLDRVPEWKVLHGEAIRLVVDHLFFRSCWLVFEDSRSWTTGQVVHEWRMGRR